jgi:hypothetical protein
MPLTSESIDADRLESASMLEVSKSLDDIALGSPNLVKNSVPQVSNGSNMTHILTIPSKFLKFFPGFPVFFFFSKDSAVP